MKSLFTDTRLLDAACREKYGLTEDIMMENAAAALEMQVLRAAESCDDTETSVIVLCGSGNNGADGYALIRRLAGKLSVSGIMVLEPKSPLCKIQAERAKKLTAPILAVSDDESVATLLSPASPHILVDCIFGSGFHGELDDRTRTLLAKTAQPAATSRRGRCVRIACDVPTGVREDGTVAEGCFCADITVTMGAEKLALYSDEAKDVTGEIVVADLGVSRTAFEDCGSAATAAYRLEKSDLVLPVRTKQNTHKGRFGHVAVVSGEKIGASCIAGSAALRFGAGLVTLVRFPQQETACGRLSMQAVSPELMTASDFPAKVSAVALGMGLGRAFAVPYIEWLSAHPELPCVIDADALYAKELPALLKSRPRGLVLTPHVKEFQALLENCNLPATLPARPALIEAFCRAYPGVVLVAKGANVMIGHYSAESGTMQLLVNPWGCAALSKAGSGDVLAGLIAALLAQGYAPLQAATSASLAHALASRAAGSYSLTPFSLIEAVASLETNAADITVCVTAGA